MKIKIVSILVVVTAILVFALSQNSQKAQVLSKNSVIPTVEITLTPIQPSEKALKIASFGVARMTDTQKVEFKDKYGTEKMTDTELIKAWSLKMDEDPILMAQNEAIMEKHMAKEGQAVYYNTYETTSSSIDTSGIENNIRQQQSDIEEQQRKMDELEREQQNREFWEGVCSNRGEQFNSLVGAGCR